MTGFDRKMADVMAVHDAIMVAIQAQIAFQLAMTFMPMSVIEAMSEKFQPSRGTGTLTPGASSETASGAQEPSGNQGG